GRLKLKNVAGKFSFRDDVFKVGVLKAGAGNPIQAQGTISIKESEPIRFTSRIWAKNSEAANLIGIFGDTFKKCLDGNLKSLNVDLKGEGGNWGEIRHTLTGAVSVHLASGEIDNEELKRGTYRLFGLPQKAVPERVSAERDRLGYEQIEGRFSLKNGVAQTEKFVYESRQRRTSVVGMFDLGKNTMDAIMGVAPLPGLDKFLTKIPVVGKIITGGDEESLVKNYYSVKGPFADPEITPVPFTSLGKKVMGIFQGILQAPAEIFPFSELEVTN
ncbi:MAG: AsmA-like C-terminal region-containing protein, partial [Nitrospinaceae bacterium]